ncbi:Uncharacterised protein [Mycobacteroides abscessus subsp. abscessus]|nr:Uncharacterised protein [Mycobacteroides abscessus subsp. abscessus]
MPSCVSPPRPPSANVSRGPPGSPRLITVSSRTSTQPTWRPLTKMPLRLRWSSAIHLPSTNLIIRWIRDTNGCVMRTSAWISRPI